MRFLREHLFSLKEIFFSPAEPEVEIEIYTTG